MTPRLLVVNADDFGYAASVNAGILDAHTGGIVTATTWLAAGAAAGEAARLARRHPALAVGLHLALSEMRPCAPPQAVAGLLENGHLPRRYTGAWARLLRDPGRIEAVEVEWRAQYAAFGEAFGRMPGHVDSHQHVALFPGLQQCFVALAVEHGVRTVRVPEEQGILRAFTGPHGPGRGLSARVLRVLARRLRGQLNATGLRATDHFAGFRLSGRATLPDLLSLAEAVAPETTEWMVHPGRSDTPDGCRRAEERAALMAPALRRVLDRAGVRLVTFGEMAEASKL